MKTARHEWNQTTQVLGIDLANDRIEQLQAVASPRLNLFVTRSPQKALLWNRLEPLDLVIIRFDQPLGQVLDLLQNLIEANPGPPILLLVEPGAEAAAHRLVQHGICHTLPASIPPDLFQQHIRQLLRLSTVSPLRGDTSAEQTAAAQRPDLAPSSVIPSSHAPINHTVSPPMLAVPRVTDHAASTHLINGSVDQAPAPATELPVPAAPASARQSAGGGGRQTDHMTRSTDWEIPFLDQLVIELAHRLKNPLVSIKTFTHLLKERFNDPEFRDRFYHVVGNDVTQLNDLIDRLLEFTEFIRPYPQPLRIADELHPAKEAVESACGAKQITLQMVPPSAPLEFHADPAQFRYLLKQLLMESVTAAPVGGQIRITVSTDAATTDRVEPTFSIRLETTAGPQARQRDWLSLELLLAKELIARHHGVLTVASTAGGRVVTATFPLGDQPRTVPALSPRADRPDTAVTIDRRQIPLTIVFRERRHGVRRRQTLPIAFTDRRRPALKPEGPHRTSPIRSGN